MSDERLERDAARWLRQAADDLEAAEALTVAGKAAQAAFLAQQAGEKALKALWIRLDLDPWGHSLGRLVRDLPDPWREPAQALRDLALQLDKLYIPTRHPDAPADLTPAEVFTAAEARAAVEAARVILEKTRTLVQEAAGGAPGA